MNENYVNHYIDIMTATMQDAILRNVSLQANAKVVDEMVGIVNKENEELRAQLDALSNGENSVISELNAQIEELKSQNGSLKSFEGDYQNIKSQAQHVDTFRKELEKARIEIEQLKKKIDYLQLTPARRKKIDEASKPVGLQVVEAPTSLPLDETKDGGSF
jgi:phage shock protein A